MPVDSAATVVGRDYVDIGGSSAGADSAAADSVVAAADSGVVVAAKAYPKGVQVPHDEFGGQVHPEKLAQHQQDS